ncbi:hypothetical protein EDB19DRAFT_198947 [Suillus lakei]|nr:hypothetical protein EDB19DRAFT_198947 [Suillus lakei]
MLGTCAPSKDPHFGDAPFFFFTCPPLFSGFLIYNPEPNKTHHQTPSTMSNPDSDSLVKTQLPDLPDDWKPPSEFRGDVSRIRSKHWSFFESCLHAESTARSKYRRIYNAPSRTMSNTYSYNPVALHPSPDLGSNTSEDPARTSVSPPSTLHNEAESQLPELSDSWKPQTQSLAGRRLTLFCRLIIGKPTLEELCWGLPPDTGFGCEHCMHEDKASH